MTTRARMPFLLGSLSALGLLAGSLAPVSAQRMGRHGMFGYSGHHGFSTGFAGASFSYHSGSFSAGFHAGYFPRNFPYHYGFGPHHRHGYFPYSYPYYAYYPAYSYGFPYTPYYGSFYLYAPLSYYGDSAYSYSPPAYAPPASPPETSYSPPESEPPYETTEDSDYYLFREPATSDDIRKEPGLKEAISDIEKAFREGDISLLERHVVPGDTLTVLSRGRASRSLSGSDYLKKTQQAFSNTESLRYDLNSAEPASAGTWSVSGTHVLRGKSGRSLRYHVGFLLKKQGDTWVITQVSADAL